MSSQLDILRARLHEKGDRIALLEALDHVAENDLVMPEWLKVELRRCIKRTFEQAGSMDQGFGLVGKLASPKRLREQETLFAIVQFSMASPGVSETAALRVALRAMRQPFSLNTARKLYREQREVNDLHEGITRRSVGR